MRQRLISAAVLVPVVVIVFLAGQPFISIAVALVAALAAYETSRLLTLAGLPSPVATSVAGAIAAVIAVPFAFGGGISLPLLVLVYLALVLVVATTVALITDQASNAREWVGTSLGIVYPGLLAFVVAITLLASPESPGAPLVGNLDYGRKWLLIIVLTVWALDTFAYLVGRAYPRGRMAPRISPKKTWSGAIGGTVAAIVVCGLLAWLTQEAPVTGVVLGVVIAVTAQAGDLTESMLKRRAGVKDSGALIPGHGGILDRVDSFLFAAPAAYMTLLALAGIGR